MEHLQDGGHAEYSFDVLETGDYLVWFRCCSLGYSPNRKKIWVWDQVSNRGGADPVVFHPDEGSHTLVIKQRDDGTELDRILINNDI